MKYQVEVVADTDLPSNVAQAIVECEDGTPLLLLAERASGPWRLCQGFEALEEGCPQRAFQMLRAV